MSFKEKKLQWLQPIVVATVIVFSITAFGVSIFANEKANYPTTHRVYSTIGGTQLMQTSPHAHLLASTTGLITISLPNNLVEYVGKLYSVDCVTPFAHVIQIQAGTLTTTWDGTNRKATCNPLVSGAGFSFRVVTQSSIRIIDPRGVTFSN